MGLWVKRPTLGSQLQQPLRLPTGETKLRYEEGISREQFILDGGGSCFPPGRSSGQLFPRSRCLPGEGPKRDQSKITMPPTPLPAGRGREKGSPSLLSKPRPAGKECHVFLFPINSPPPPPPAALCILETKSQDSHRGELGVLAGTPLVAGPRAKRQPPRT